MSENHNPLEVEIASTLRGLIKLPRLSHGSQLAEPGFWSRCQRVNPGYGHRMIVVDGFARCCRWNSWKVYTDAREPGLTLWLGYACSWDRWVEHAWCMLGDRIIETTMERAVYYGAELTQAERQVFGLRHGRVEQDALVKVPVMTFVDGRRTHVPYNAAEYAQSIGRERDPMTRDIKEGLGR